jgi:hypothetical protein
MKILRLIHGDVYCGARLFRFGLIDSDRCIRCFAEETREHLQHGCPYSGEVWGRLGLFPRQTADILQAHISSMELEFRAELISNLVFCKKVLPPEVLIRTVVNRFKMGLSQSKGMREYATTLVERHELTGKWFT